MAIDAIAHGRAAALAIDQYMRTRRKAAWQENVFISRKDAFGEIPESEFLQVPRIERSTWPSSAWRNGSKSQVEVEVGFTEGQAAQRDGPLPGVRLRFRISTAN